MLTLTPDSCSITDFHGNPISAKEFEVTWDAGAAQKNGFAHFMAKEIMEQPKAISDSLMGRLDEQGKLVLNEIRLSDDEIRDIDKVIIIGCGSAFHAGMIAKYGIEHWSRLPVEVELASEFRFRCVRRRRPWAHLPLSPSGTPLARAAPCYA